ncbi:MAG: hypothetical protein U5K53_04875 [Halanaerobiales bacterium]|nr:hypothetical protein [Halanaerobiales bacterium]
MNKSRLKGYLFRFAVVHTLIYIITGVIFQNYLNYDPQFTSSVLYNNFREVDSFIIRFAPIFQLMRGIFIGLIIYPVYGGIVKSQYSWLKLFALLWGLTLIGSVAATPGSIEGFIYTKIPVIEHLVGLPEVTLQAFLFSIIFIKWDKKNINNTKQTSDMIDKESD